eukprot:TRINITY_DN7081_c0_g1_i1.p1 TRINITY_DN7081_c0_g1~~TRINITY_DN7081_c0_g1_i1.p1  ORF type:complete len:111 (-),score=14.58 TRINITY_DN7081_c0_g1_i1:34-366(-)
MAIFNFQLDSHRVASYCDNNLGCLAKLNFIEFNNQSFVLTGILEPKFLSKDGIEISGITIYGYDIKAFNRPKEVLRFSLNLNNSDTDIESEHRIEAVSYTHLTLPTIYSV